MDERTRESDAPEEPVSWLLVALSVVGCVLATVYIVWMIELWWPSYSPLTTWAREFAMWGARTWPR